MSRFFMNDAKPLDYDEWKRRRIMPGSRYEKANPLQYYGNIVGYCKKVAEDPDTTVSDRLKAMEVGAMASHFQLVYLQWFPDAPNPAGQPENEAT